MKTQIRESRYKDQPAMTVESAALSVQYLPGIGAKLCSFVYKPAGLELLVQRPAPQYRLAPYDGDYVGQGECSGLDDMFPSIDRCFYEGYPWRGTPIPDHGEVWCLPWEVEVTAGRLHFTTYGVRFPYKLEKWVSFRSDELLHADYRLTNLSGFDFDFMWAAHPMFNLEEGAQLALPDGCEKIVIALSFTGRLGRYGDELAWPVAELPGGGRRDLRLLQPKSAGDAVKYFVKGRMPEGWCTLTYPRSRCTLRMAFPAEQVPYLAILSNEGGWHDLYNIFLEPATASFDRLDIARVRGECSMVKAHAVYEWYLDLQVSPGTVSTPSG